MLILIWILILGVGGWLIYKALRWLTSPVVKKMHFPPEEKDYLADILKKDDE